MVGIFPAKYFRNFSLNLNAVITSILSRNFLIEPDGLLLVLKSKCERPVTLLGAASHIFFDRGMRGFNLNYATIVISTLKRNYQHCKIPHFRCSSGTLLGAESSI
jgi:hypothetical protein